MKISVVIPTYNRRASLSRCLGAIEKQTLDRSLFEVIVVNDGSPDDTAGYLNNYISETGVNLVSVNKENEGPAMARNSAIGIARGGFVAFTDDDCVPHERWLEDLLEDFPDDPLCAGLGGKILRLYDTLLSRYIDEVTPLAHQIDEDEINFLVTANAMYRSSVLQQMDGFHTQITWAGGEDPELSLRIIQNGYYLAITERALVNHDHRATLKGLYRTNINYGKGMKMIVQLHGRERNITVEIYKFTLSRIFKALVSIFERKGLGLKSRIFYFLADIQVLAGFHRGYVKCPEIETEFSEI